MSEFSKLFKDFANIKAGVIGDVMLDTYWWGHVERISPEAPVPVVTLDRKEYRIGGAGNVALNLASLGAHVATFSVIGTEEEGRLLERLLEEATIDTKYLLKSDNRITTNKARIMGRNQQMLRLDSETTQDLSPEEEDKLLSMIEKYLRVEKPQVMIFEDYNKGVLTSRVIREAIALCEKEGIVTAVDPKRKNFFSYRGVTIFKPNLKEVKEGLNLLLDEVRLPVLQNIHEQLAKQLHHHISFITLSEKGVFYSGGQRSDIVSSHVRNIADVSGAGDTVIAVASLVYAVTKDVRLMAEVANIAGGLVCEEVGTAAINKDRLLEECDLLLGEKSVQQ
ncbi:PfkB family carbohydrate kinase [Flavitalea sp. BT771]|uniref:bifunctional heptose 7-phosphate kinase/heptose 1-phosphate adenyltransferase n=1 Tax=Flavitalea sp. BT771 TaxID=3063329 RepID=UPI0026E28FCA|nr:PfkB family carbohydrate kinase [Flavitalea sp. BT771]MDO6432038.1 PfkB family carbohydrate kinase [Flavitalea sp. BT771]MDV6220947.1 PfkB family carbohydrate kinase [Flavitalea sp. BT771]